MSSIVTLTNEQRQARDARDVSVALSAGAGCGKTFVLTERFLSHLEPSEEDAPEPAELHQLVAITFTDAAAREMRSRIRAKCHERLQVARTGKDQDYWLRLLRAIDQARVSTIHAFCTSLLRSHAVEAGLDPTFGVLDQPAADVLQGAVMDDVLRERLERRDDDTLDLAAAYGLEQLKRQLRELLSRHHIEAFGKWLEAAPDQLVAAWETHYDREAFTAAVAEIAAEAPIDPIMELLQSVEPPRQKPAFVAAKAELLELMPRLAACQVTEHQLQTIRERAGVQKICTAKDWPQPADYDEYKTACKKLRDLLDKRLPQPFDPVAARRVAALGLALLRLADEVAQRYKHVKTEGDKLDFDDQLALTYALLTKHPAVRERLSTGLQLLLVDEFQDTDKLQVDLIEVLCGEALQAGKLFFVGDFKQSIYRFRRAEPENFLNLRSSVPEPGRLPLTENFRSQPAILHFVNALFSDSFDGYEPLRPHRPQTTAEPCVEFLWTLTPDKKGNQKGAAEQARRQEARWIARRLRQMVDGKEELIVGKESGRPRPVQLGDIAILFRALSDVQHYEEALRDYGLDYYLVGGHAFYSQQEIYDVLNLLRAVATPADEISLAGALRSPFFSLADETLFWLAESSDSLNAGLRRDRLPPELSPEERAKAAAAAETIAHLRGIKDTVPIATLLGEALNRTGYDGALLAEFLGERKLANLHKLLEQARAADRGGELDLDGFITQLAQFTAEEPKEALAATAAESADVIRLMTIHYAKGLEFPLVVIPDLDRPPIFPKPAAALHPKLGPLVPASNDEDKQGTTGMDLFRDIERREEIEERKRLLYVACTRAADYLMLTSSLAGYDDLKSDWIKLLAERFELQTGRLKGSVPEGYDTPRVRATLEEPTTDRAPAGISRRPDVIRVLDEARAMAERSEGVVPREVAPVPVDHEARRQFSFSRLTGRLVRHDPINVPISGEQMEDAAPRVDPRGLGSLVHAVLERVDFRGENPIGRWCEQLAGEHVFENTQEAAAQAREMIERFAVSPRWRELADAAAIHPEVEFLLAWPPGADDGRGRYLQGYIDCLYQDPSGGWHLLDYKTNHVTADRYTQTAEQYEMQMGVYAIAAEQALGRPPAELVLHFLRPGAEHVFPWDDAARHRTFQLVNHAISAISD